MKTKSKEMRNWITSVMVLFSIGVQAQEALGDVVGIVFETPQQTIVGAQVFIKDQDRKYIAITDVNGRFRITGIPAGKYDMSIKFMQDTMYGIAVSIPMDGFHNAGNIVFKPNTIELKGVVVKANNDMKLVYGFVSKHESLEQMIEKSARELATEIVMRTHATMTLEDQQNSKERFEQAIEQKTAEIKFEMPRYLWTV